MSVDTLDASKRDKPTCAGLLLTLYALRLQGRVPAPLTLAPTALAFAVAASRVRDNWHFPSDVVAGILLGGACASLAPHPRIYRPSEGRFCTYAR